MNKVLRNLLDGIKNTIKDSQLLNKIMINPLFVLRTYNDIDHILPVIWKFLQWNPLLQIIDSLRKVTIWGSHPDWGAIGYAWCFGIVVLLGGSWFFNRLRPAFADVL